MITVVFNVNGDLITRMVDECHRPHLNEVVTFTHEGKTVRGSVSVINHPLDEKGAVIIAHLRTF
ncbi:MAG: hypothetical protein QG642_266 [Patescibacteria group bacterium]|nr:hypothetical protein [Patescibacteria group bacterium]